MPVGNESAIYNRLASAPTFRPANAVLFSDWSIEPGDIVQVQHEGTTYSVPVYSSSLTWKGGFHDGTSLVEVRSSGNKSRAPLPALKRKEYSSGYGGYVRGKAQEEKIKLYERAMIDTDELLGLYAYEFKEDKNAKDGRLLVAETALEQTAREIKLRARTAYMEARLSVTAEAIRSEVENYYAGLRGYVIQTAERLQSEYTNQYNGLRGYVVQTAAYLQSEYTNQYNGLRGYVLQTAERLQSEYTDQYNGLRGYVVQTAAYLKSEYTDQYNGLRGYVVQTAKYLKSEYTDQYNGLRGYVVQTAAYLKSEYTDQYNGLRGYVVQTAKYLKSEYTDQYNGLRGYVVQTAKYLKSEYTDQYNGLRGYLLQTAERLQSEYTDQYNGLRGYVVQTAGFLQSEYTDQYNGLRGYVVQTAAYLQSEYTDQYNGLRGYVVQTAAYLKSEYTNQYTGLYTRITQNASNIELLSGDVDDITASELWLNKDSITAVTGDMEHRQEYVEDENGNYWLHPTRDVYYDKTITPVPSWYNGKMYSLVDRLYVKEGVGLRTEKTVIDQQGEEHKVSLGIYNEDTLTAGVLVSKINADGPQKAALGFYDSGTLTAGVLITKLNDNSTSATIKASRINLEGYVQASDITAEYIKNKIASITNVLAKNITINTSGYVRFDTPDGYVTLTGASAADIIKNLRITLSGNTYALEKVTFGDDSWQQIGTFSRATTLTGSWNSGTYTVTASPQGNTKSTEILLGAAGAGTTNFSVYAYHDSITSGNEVKIGYIYLTEDTTNKKVQARWGGSSGTVYGEIPISLETKSISSNGTYTPSSGKTGFSSVTVNVSGGGSPTIDLNNQQYWQASSSTTPWSASEGVTTLNTSASIISEHAKTHEYGYLVFRITAGSTNKWYRISLPYS